MGALRTSFVAACLVLAAPTHAESVVDWRAFINEASARFDVPSAWIEQVMRAESNGQTTLRGRAIRSSAGAIGLMQLMPATWADMRARLGLGFNPDDPRDNILAGTFYLRLMYERFGFPGLFGAYNAGPGRYSEHLAGRRSLPGETVDYLAKVSPSASTPVAIASTQTPPPSLFAVRNDARQTDVEQPDSAPSSSLFVSLSQGK